MLFSDLKLWYFDEKKGNLRHESGRFFSIDGIRVNTNWGKLSTWDQPIINQPEVGFLGIIVKKINGVYHFLMQAKIEPGNINVVQLSPTLQATKSNYSRVHKGKSPLYLEYFKGEKHRLVLVDQLQSEQGARFLKKRNRNIIIEVYEDIPVYDNFCWLTLGQIKEFIKYDNIVNMDTRTVISCIQFGNYDSNTLDFYSILNNNKDIVSDIEGDFLYSVLVKDVHYLNFDEIISWITEQKALFGKKNL